MKEREHPRYGFNCCPFCEIRFYAGKCPKCLTIFDDNSRWKDLGALKRKEKRENHKSIK